MGTNFYLQRKNPENGRCTDLHICKLSYGWVPNMVGYTKDFNIWLGDDLPEIKTWTDWKWFLMQEIAKGGIIFDEYDEPFTYEKFIKRVENHANKKTFGSNLNNQRPLKNHAVEMLNGAFDNQINEDTKKKYWTDRNETFSFSAVEFS